MTDYDIGIIGGGAAGLTVAAGAGRFGLKTLLIEKVGRLGGDCLHFGCVPSKTLIRSASAWSIASRAEEFGLPPLDRGSVDLGKVMDRVAGVISRVGEHDAVERFSGLGVDTLFGAPSFTDSHTVSLDGKSISARFWVIATGSRPTLPPVPGLDQIGCLTNETIFSLRVLPKKLFILGGGPVGLELAQAFSRLGSAVTVIEFQPSILGAEDEDVSALLLESLKNEGVEILTSTRVIGAEKASRGVTITLGDKDGKVKGVLEGDALLAATGRAPNVAGLGLENAGVAFGPGGIATDLRLRTNVSHIYACGDVNGKFPFTHVAGQEGSTALANIVFRLPRRIDYSLVPWVVYTDPEVAGVGLNEAAAKKAGIPYKILEEQFKGNDRAVADGETKGKIKVLVSPRGKLLGCRIIGHKAGEVLPLWVQALASKVKLSALSQTMHPYPGYSEISRRVAGDWYADKLFGNRTRRLLRTIFGYRGRGPDK